MNFMPRTMLSHGRTRTLTAVEKNKLKLLSVSESCKPQLVERYCRGE